MRRDDKQIVLQQPMSKRRHSTKSLPNHQTNGKSTDFLPPINSLRKKNRYIEIHTDREEEKKITYICIYIVYFQQRGPLLREKDNSLGYLPVMESAPFINCLSLDTTSLFSLQETRIMISLHF